MAKGREDDEEKEESEIKDRDWTTVAIEKKYRHYLQSQGISANELVRLFMEGKLKKVEESEEEKENDKDKEKDKGKSKEKGKKNEKEEEGSGDDRKEKKKVKAKEEEKEDKVHRVIEEVAVRQVENAISLAEENMKKHLLELEEKAKKADELEKKLIMKEKEELEKRIKSLEEHREQLKREALKGMEIIKERYKGEDKSSIEKRIEVVEQRIEELLKKFEYDPWEQYRKELERMAEFKKVMDEKFKEIFPEYVKKEKEEEKGMTMSDLLRLFQVVNPTVNNLVNTVVGGFMNSRQIDILLAKAERAPTPEIADRYLKRADMLIEMWSRKMGMGMNMANTMNNSNVANASTPVVGVPGNYEETLIGILKAISVSDIEKFKNGELSLVPFIRDNLEQVIQALRINPGLYEQIKNLSAETVIERIKKERSDIVVDEVLANRIRGELEDIRKMVVEAMEGSRANGSGVMNNNAGGVWFGF